MELKVYVEGIQRVVCGLTDASTCEEVVFALAHAIGRSGRFTLVEKWRESERMILPGENPLQVLRKWGEFANDVKFELRWTESISKPSIDKKLFTTPLRNNGDSFNDSSRFERRTSSSIKKSLTFSGARRPYTTKKTVTKGRSASTTKSRTGRQLVADNSSLDSYDDSSSCSSPYSSIRLMNGGDSAFTSQRHDISHQLNQHHHLARDSHNRSSSSSAGTSSGSGPGSACTGSGGVPGIGSPNSSYRYRNGVLPHGTRGQNNDSRLQQPPQGSDSTQRIRSNETGSKTHIRTSGTSEHVPDRTTLTDHTIPADPHTLADRTILSDPPTLADRTTDMNRSPHKRSASSDFLSDHLRGDLRRGGDVSNVSATSHHRTASNDRLESTRTHFRTSSTDRNGPRSDDRITRPSHMRYDSRDTQPPRPPPHNDTSAKDRTAQRTNGMSGGGDTYEEYDLDGVLNDHEREKEELLRLVQLQKEKLSEQQLNISQISEGKANMKTLFLLSFIINILRL